MKLAQPRNFFCAVVGAFQHKAAPALLALHCVETLLGQDPSRQGQCAPKFPGSSREGGRVLHGVHRDVRGCAVLRGVWQKAVYGQSDTGMFAASGTSSPGTMHAPPECPSGSAPGAGQFGVSGVHKTAYS